MELSEEQQADLDDGWGVVVKSNKGRVKQVMAGQGGGGQGGGVASGGGAGAVVLYWTEGY